MAPTIEQIFMWITISPLKIRLAKVRDLRARRLITTDCRLITSGILPSALQVIVVNANVQICS